MTQLLLSPEIFVAATRSAGGPAAELFTAYLAKNELVQYVLTPWLKGEVEKQLIDAGYDEATAKDQVDFIASLGQVEEDPEELGEDPLVAIAEHLKIEKVHEASGRDGQQSGNVTFVPVHELMTYLQGL